MTTEKDPRRGIGQKSEDHVVRYLRDELGYEIVSRNYRTLDGEIDIIALDRKILVFVEVRTKSGPGFSEFSINGKKKRKMCKVALKYIENASRDYQEIRFDAVFVTKEPNVVFEHVENIIMLA